MKRFWREVGVVPAAAGGATVELDGRPLRTPGRRPLLAPTAALAEIVAGEWRDQGEEVEPRTMPATRLASTVADRMPELRVAAVEEVMTIAGTDLLCYRASGPDELIRHQEEAWQPLLDWLGARYDAPLAVTRGIAPVAQADTSLTRLRGVVDGLDDWRLVGLHAVVQGLGSLVLGLAVLSGRLRADDAVDLGLLDERYQIERWGWDVEIDRRHRALRADVAAAAGFLLALAGGEEP